MIKNYVKYEDEKNNDYINGLSKFNDKLNIMTIKNGEAVARKVAEDGYWPSRFKNVRNISDLNNALSRNETLIIEIDFDDLDKINQNNLFQIRTPEKEDKVILGGKCYLVNYDFSFEGLPKEVEKAFEPVVVLKDVKSPMEDTPDTYAIKQVHTIRANISERRNDIANGYGGYSDLYHKTTNPDIAKVFSDDIFEFTCVAPGKWIITKQPEYTLDSFSK